MPIPVMKPLLSAKMARGLVNDMQVRMKNILREIENAAMEGCTGMTFNTYFHPDITARLKELGYEIDEYEVGFIDHPRTFVNWK